MASITEVADKFFVACETGKGWEGCKAYCTPDAAFAAQAEPLADVRTLQQYCDWMKDGFGPIPDGRYGDCQKFCVRDFCEGGFRFVVSIENAASEAWSASLLGCSERSSPKAA